jgi:HK97 family phage major capsid protein
MADTQKIREEIEALDVEIRSLHQTDEGELREFSDDEQADFDAKVALREKKLALLKRHEAIENAAKVPERTVPVDAPAVIVKRDAMDVMEDRTSTRKQLEDAAIRSLEEQDVEPENLAHVRKVLKAHSRDRGWIDSMILRSTDTYASAWLKMVKGREFTLTNEERTVLGVSTNANGKFLLPTHLDPTIILTSALSTNEIRKIARVVTLTDGQPSWNGITSAGVTASWDGEVVEVSDDSPTFGQPSIPTERAQALVQASISAVEDISDLGSDVMMMFADAKDRLEGAAHANGAGTNDQPTGVFAAVAAVTASRVVSTTAATIGLVDLNSVYTGVLLRRPAGGHRLGDPESPGGRVGRRADHADDHGARPRGAARRLLAVRDRRPSGRHVGRIHPAPVRDREQPARRSPGLVRHLAQRWRRDQRRRLPPARGQDHGLSRGPWDGGLSHRLGRPDSSGSGRPIPPPPPEDNPGRKPLCRTPQSPSPSATPRPARSSPSTPPSTTTPATSS